MFFENKVFFKIVPIFNEGPWLEEPVKGNIANTILKNNGTFIYV